DEIRKIVLEQQSRPQITLEQIRQLIQEQPVHQHRRQGRPLGRSNHEDEEEDRSEKSTVSLRPRRQLRRHDGGNRLGYAGGRRRLEFPIFKEDDVYGWLVRVERYFRLNEVRMQDKVDTVVLAMEEKSLNWFQWWEEQTPLRN
ncbi:hypothetical protein L195_g061033, partial [Trifolium pratense]